MLYVASWVECFAHFSIKGDIFKKHPILFFLFIWTLLNKTIFLRSFTSNRKGKPCNWVTMATKMLHSEDYINNHSREIVIGWNDDDGIWSSNCIEIPFKNIICKCIPEQHTKSNRSQYLGNKSRWPQGTQNQLPRFYLQVNHVSVLFCCKEKFLW